MTSDVDLTDRERAVVNGFQGEFPAAERPFEPAAPAMRGAWVDITVTELLETVARFEREGKIRRIGVVPNHYALGYTENGMPVWNVPDDLAGEVGPAIISLPFVTHCYERPRHEGAWPYNVFAMTHGRSEAESRCRIERVQETMAEYWTVGDEDWDSLFSTQVLKKTGIRLAERANANTAGNLNAA